MKSRVFEVMQYEVNPKTNESLNFTEENIIKGINHKTIKEWAYVCHDKDSNDDGTLKGKHWHVVCRSDYAVDFDNVAKWFGVPVQQVQEKKGRGGFLDGVEYLTHESEKQQTLGKYRYPDEEVESNFDWRQRLTDRTANKMKYGKDNLTDKEKIRMQVLKEGKPLRDVLEENPIIYAEDLSTLTKLRNQYLSNLQLPPVRINYYIEGKGGVGKGVLSRILAKSLFPSEFDDDSYFVVGANGALFEGYDGQPVIIWEDRRSAQLLKELGGRGNVFNVFDTVPTRNKQNIKYSSVCLTNAVNIINGTESYEAFLNGLAGEYKDKDGNQYKAEDKGQSYRRFPMIICLHESDFDMLINKGFAEGTFEYDQYNIYKGIVGNFGKVKKALNSIYGEPLLIDMSKSIVDEHKKLEEKVIEKKISSIEDFPEDIWFYGITTEEANIQKARVEYIRAIYNKNYDKEKKEEIALGIMADNNLLGENDDEIFNKITDEDLETLPKYCKEAFKKELREILFYNNKQCSLKR